MATAIAAALNATLSPAERSRVSAVPTRNLQAWEAHQLGKQRMTSRTARGLAEAETFFQRAIDLDRKFAPAYADLANTLSMQASRVNAPLTAILARADEAAGTALRLDPNLAEAWASAGPIAHMRGQGDRAEQMYRRAIALNPSYATAYQWLGGVLSEQGRLEEGYRYLERALELDPLSAIINEDLGEQLQSFGRFDAAEARYRKVIEIDPSRPYPYLNMGLIEAYARNRFAVAVQLVEKAVQLDPETLWLRLDLAQLYLDLGREDDATRLIEDVRMRWPENELAITVAAIMAMFQGEEEAARRQAAAGLAQDPRDYYGLILLDIVDLRLGRYDAARRRHAAGYPELLAAGTPAVDGSNVYAAINLAHILLNTGETARAAMLLDRAEALARSGPRLGATGYGIADVEILALRGRNRAALSALRAAAQAGWRGGAWPLRYYRDFDPNLASVRDAAEFKAVFADIEHDMARQRAVMDRSAGSSSIVPAKP